jgi:hypothetical protein
MDLVAGARLVIVTGSNLTSANWYSVINSKQNKERKREREKERKRERENERKREKERKRERNVYITEIDI